MSKREFNADPNHPFIQYIGEFKYGDKFLDSKHDWPWVFVKYLNALFRGVGQVIFCNNPFTGLVILACLYWSDLTVGLATTLAASTAILTAFIFQQDIANINAGLTTYSAVLVGSVTSSIWMPTFGEPLNLRIWGFIILCAALSVPVGVGITNLFSRSKQSVPPFTFAFNIVTLLLFTVAAPPRTTPTSLVPVSVTPPISDQIIWSGVLKGIALSMGQVYGMNNLEGSILMYFSTMFYSPTVFMMSLVGATVGSLFGLAFDVAPYANVYDGIWGFNAILAAIAVGGFYFALTWLSFITAVADVLLAVIIQQALSIAFTPLRLPFLTYPFVLSSTIFLGMSASGHLLYRVPKFSVPEIHKYEYLEAIRSGKLAEKNGTSRGSSDSEPLYRRTLLKPSAPLLPSVATDTDTSIYPNMVQSVTKQNRYVDQDYGANVMPIFPNNRSIGFYEDDLNARQLENNRNYFDDDYEYGGPSRRMVRNTGPHASLRNPAYNPSYQSHLTDYDRVNERISRRALNHCQNYRN